MVPEYRGQEWISHITQWILPRTESSSVMGLLLYEALSSNYVELFRWLHEQMSQYGAEFAASHLHLALMSALSDQSFVVVRYVLSQLHPIEWETESHSSSCARSGDVELVEWASALPSA